jgi:hypothetical protein
MKSRLLAWLRPGLGWLCEEAYWPAYPGHGAVLWSSRVAIVPLEQARRGRWVPHPIAAKTARKGGTVKVALAPRSSCLDRPALESYHDGKRMRHPVTGLHRRQPASLRVGGVNTDQW